MSFDISFPEVTLDIDQIWPDGDAPENPTAADVVKQMQESTGSVYRVLSEWALEPNEITVHGSDGTRAVHR